jgi:hypothetical protein
MRTTARAVAAEVEGLLDYLLESDLAVYVNPVRRNGGEVSWHPVGGSMPFLLQRGPTQVHDYVRWLRGGHYSALLFDGSLLQITYEVIAGFVTRHRLAYVACPFNIDPELLQVGLPSDIADLYEETPASRLNMVTVLRFDYDIETAGPGHPASHLTMNAPECRIPCAGPMRLGRFADFTFRHFYGATWKKHRKFIDNMPKAAIGKKTLAADEATQPHITWPF